MRRTVDPPLRGRRQRSARREIDLYPRVVVEEAPGEGEIERAERMDEVGRERVGRIEELEAIADSCAATLDKAPVKRRVGGDGDEKDGGLNA